MGFSGLRFQVFGLGGLGFNEWVLIDHGLLDTLLLTRILRGIPVLEEGGVLSLGVRGSVEDAIPSEFKLEPVFEVLSVESRRLIGFWSVGVHKEP